MAKKIKRSSVILAFILAVCTAFTAMSASAAQFKTVSGNFNYTYANEVLTLVNNERKSAGLKPVVMTAELTGGAMKRAAETAVNFSHTRPNGQQCFTAFSWTGAAGENIAFGQKTPQEVMNGWMNSSGHRANILSPNFTTIGIGCFEYEGRFYWAQAFSGGSGKSSLQAGRKPVTVDVSLTPGVDSAVKFADDSQNETAAPDITKKAAETSTKESASNKSETKRTTKRNYVSSSQRRYQSRGRNVYSRIRYYFRYFFIRA